MLVVTIICWGGITTSYLAMGLMVYDWLRGPEEIEVLTKTK